jgi:hypothetical protein
VTEHKAVDRIPRSCGYGGCDVVVQNRRGFCVAHYSVAWPCSFDESCPYRCAAHSRTRLCQAHRWFAHKLRVDRLDRLAARIDADGEE